MKTIFNEYIKIVVYLICGILLVMSSYTILLNINHYKSLSSEISVSEIDNDYLDYKKNVNLIEKEINSIDDKAKNVLKDTLNVMKKDGVYRLIPKTKLTYNDLYELNDYFIEELINNGWVSKIRELDISNQYQDTIMLLVNNSNYMNSVFTNNSLYLSDTSLDSKIEDNYHFILSNYKMYSNVILDICNKLGGTSGKVN